VWASQRPASLSDGILTAEIEILELLVNYDHRWRMLVVLVRAVERTKQSEKKGLRFLCDKNAVDYSRSARSIRNFARSFTRAEFSTVTVLQLSVEMNVVSFAKRSILSFDTSAVNQLADDSDSEALVAGLGSGYFIRFPFTTVSEIVANSSSQRRKELLRVCRRLLLEAGDCIEPHHEIMKTMVARFERSLPLGVAHINLRVQEAEDDILREVNFADDLAKQEREEGRAHNKVFVDVYADAKVALDELDASGIAMPGSVSALISQLQEGGAFWTLARDLYERVATLPADDATIQRFYGECEPLRALMIAIFAAQFDRCIRPPNQGPSLRSGRNDTFTATFLPYWDQFVTHDDGQLACYREVVSIGGFDVTIRSYEEFRDRLLVAGSAVVAAAR